MFKFPQVAPHHIYYVHASSFLHVTGSLAICVQEIELVFVFIKRYCCAEVVLCEGSAGYFSAGLYQRNMEEWGDQSSHIVTFPMVKVATLSM